jgi:ubiquinone/menaquinone biosynthesis C-methylase UbiE
MRYKGCVNTVQRDKSLLRGWNRLDALALFFQHSRERAISRLLQDYYRRAKDWRVLEVGCGSGRLLLLLREMEIGRKLFGCDIKKDELDGKLTTLGIALVVNPPDVLAFGDARFDMIVQSVVFSSVPDADVRTKLAREMDRVLAPGGVILWFDVIKTRGNLVGFYRKEIGKLFPGYAMQGFRCGLNYRLAASLAYKSQALVTLAEAMPFWRSHWALILTKPKG